MPLSRHFPVQRWPYLSGPPSVVPPLPLAMPPHIHAHQVKHPFRHRLPCDPSESSSDRLQDPQLVFSHVFVLLFYQCCWMHDECGFFKKFRGALY